MKLKDYLPYYKRNLKVAIPVTLTQLGGGIVAIVDNVMVGHLGAYELGAVAFGNSIFFMVYMFTVGSVMGLTPLVGEAYVQDKHKKVGQYFQNALLFTLILGALACLVLTICYPLMHYMGQDIRIVEIAQPYFITSIVSLIPFLLFCTCKQFLEGLGNTKMAMIITLTANIVNIIFNYLLIYGKFGFPQWGVLGAGIATLIARTLMFVMFVIAIRFNKEWWQYVKAFSWKFFSKSTLFKLAKTGMPIGSHFTMETCAFVLSSIMIGWLGVIDLAGNQITQNVSHLAFQIVVGISLATTIRVSHQKGLGDVHALRMAGKASVHLCLMANILTASLMIGLRNYIPRIYTTDPEVINAAATLLICAGLFQLSDGMQAVGAGILRGISDVSTLTRSAFISYICINIPVGYLLAFTFGLGASGIWIGFIIGLSTAAILFHTRCWSTIRKNEELWTTAHKQ